MLDLLNNRLISVLIFLLIFIIVIQLLRKTILKDKVISGIIALTVALLGVFYMSSSQFNFITQTYSLAGTILLIAIPYLIIFFFLYSSGLIGLLRKMSWVFVGILTFMFIQNNNSLTSETTANITVGIVLITIFLLLFDNKIKDQFNISKNLKKSK